jgi:hypothetical protein
MLSIANRELSVTGRLIKTARLKAEYYETVDAPADFIKELQTKSIKADLFSFLQGAADTTPRFPYHVENDRISVLPITTYEHWWKSQIGDKVRNMARKAGKKGVDIKVVPFDNALVNGIAAIYNESPVRQGRRFSHYGKDLATIYRDHATFIDRSEFIGAYLHEELIGFIKLVHGADVSNLMQIIAKMVHRDKAPIDALLAKAVEICAQKGVRRLHYGIWGRGGLREYKVHRGFQCVEVPRYYVGLTLKGTIALRARLHRNLSEYIPDSWHPTIASWRTKWYSLRYRLKSAPGRS